MLVTPSFPRSLAMPRATWRFVGRCAKKIEHQARLRVDTWYREETRLRGLGSMVPTETVLFGRPFKIADAYVFLTQFDEIVRREIYRFNSRSAKPLILDVGANIGVSVAYFKWLYPDARIIAFEPDPQLFELLRTNIASLGLRNIQLINKAVWCEDTSLGFCAQGADASRIVKSGDPQTAVVETVSLRGYIDEPIAMLKVDIEGAETTVLESIGDLMGQVENIFVEYHSFQSEPQSLDRILSVLGVGGLRIYLEPVYEVRQPFIERRRDRGMDAQFNIFGFRSESQWGPA